MINALERGPLNASYCGGAVADDAGKKWERTSVWNRRVTAACID